MKLSLEIYLRALGIYALLTIPALKRDSLYLISIICALILGLFTWWVFTLIPGTTQYLPVSKNKKWILVIFAIPVAVSLGYTLIELFGWARVAWRFNDRLLFPIAAVIAGWISLYKSKDKITATF